MKPQITREYEFDAQYGLPEALPAGEQLLWQGTPDARVIARRVFHINKVALYFAVLLAWRVASTLSDGGSAVDALQSLVWLAPIFALALGLLVLLARWTARTTVYSLTNKRLVMRIGIVLTVAYNLPLTRIEAADVRDAGGGCQDLCLTLERGTRIAWLHLWPHVRPWRASKPQPMLRALRDGEAMAVLLRQAWSDANNTAARPAAQADSQDRMQPAPWGAHAA